MGFFLMHRATTWLLRKVRCGRKPRTGMWMLRWTACFMLQATASYGHGMVGMLCFCYGVFEEETPHGQSVGCGSRRNARVGVREAD